MLTIIGISGKKQSGKDTLCKYITELSATPVVRMAFADELKEEVAKACGVSVEFTEKHKEDFRPAWQWWGTDYRRKFHGDAYWVNKLLYKLNNLDTSKPLIVIVTDVRFRSEASILNQIGAKLVRVIRPVFIDDRHSSETELDSYKHFDYIANNDMEVQKLKMHAEIILQRFKLPLKNHGNTNTKHIHTTKMLPTQ